MLAAADQGGLPGVGVRTAVVRIGVDEDSVAAHRYSVGEWPWAVAGEFEVASAHHDADSVAGRDDHRRRPDLDLQLDRLARS